MNVNVRQPVILLLNYVMPFLEARIRGHIPEDQVSGLELTVCMYVDLEWKQSIELNNFDEIKILLMGTQICKEEYTCIRTKIIRLINNK